MGDVCPVCGNKVAADARFCASCGSAQGTACPGCGAPVKNRSARFCEQCGTALASAGAPPSTPATISTPTPVSFAAGRYEVRRLLGEGGLKRVYQAYDRALDRDVAVATIKTEDLDAAGLERVRREAQAMGRLGNHPHIVTVYDIGEEDGRPFIVSQYMPGGSVDGLVEGAAEHRLPVTEAVRIADEVCQALEHAHRQGIVHRDIKPANIWLDEDGRTRLGDFGLAAVAASPDRSRLTKEGMMVGTVAYMAPEQALGQEVDARADLYSLGALLYELLTGRPPFVGRDAVSVISQQINTPPMAPWWHNPAVPKEVGGVVLELLAKTPEDRPPGAAEVRRRLTEALTSTAPTSGEQVPTPPEPVEKHPTASAVAIQQALHAHAEAHPEEAVRVRMGLHTGEAVKEGDDFFGTHVALAARIAAAARGGEILVSSLLKELTGGSGDFAFGPARDIDLKGFSGSRQVHPLRWQEEPEEPADGATAGLRDEERDDQAVGATAGPSLPSTSQRFVTLLVTDEDTDRTGGPAEAAGEYGELLPNEGGVIFDSVADAVSAAVRLLEVEPSLRVGLHAAVLLSDGLAGKEAAVSVARRLCGRAAAGRAVCSGIVARLLAGRPRLAFVPLPAETGEQRGPDDAFEVRADAGGGPFSPPSDLIGREHEVGRLLERVELAAAGQGGLAILAGEQGIGKTRLLDDFATRVERLGCSVLWGRCHEGDWPPPYGAFIEVLEAQAALSGVTELRRDLGDAAGAVAQLAPAVRRLLPDATSAPVPPEEERQRILDGVSRFLVARSRHVPVVLILDDLHWADRATVALLRHLVRLVASERLLVVGTYRDVDLDRAHPLSDALAAWPRQPGYDHLRLEGLDGEEVADFLAAAGDQEIELKVGSAWARETGGNPFFILELLRNLHEEGKLYRGVDGGWTTVAPLRDLALPVAARDVALRRLSRLSEDANRLLTVASALEGAFRFEIVADLAGLSEDAGLDALDEAVGARILEPSGDSETYTFTHAVIRHALYDGLVPSRRSRLHRRVAEALAGAASGPTPASAAEITVHYHRSVALPGAEAGVAPALEAADKAQATGAYDEAGTFLRIALDLLPRDDPRRPRTLGRLGIVLAWALAFDDATQVAGTAGDAIAEAETGQAAAEYLSNAAYACASAGGIVPSWQLARHGLGYAGAHDVAWARMTCFDYQRREAEDPDGPGIPIESADRLEAAAILRAGRLDPIGPAPMEAACASRQEALASENAIIHFYWCGDYARALPVLEAEADQAMSRGQLARAGRCRAFVAMCQASLGNLDEARQALDQTQALATRLGVSIFPALQARECLAIATDEGLEDLAAALAPLTASVIPAIAWLLGCVHAWDARIAARLGRSEEALRSLALLTPWLERAPTWTIGFPVIASHAAETLWVLERLDHLPVIERALRDKVIASDFRSTGADGRLAMARLCGLSGRYDEATCWFNDARRVLTDQGARSLLAIADYDEALMFLRRGGPDDANRAGPLLDTAWKQFDQLGMTGWILRAEELTRPGQ